MQKSFIGSFVYLPPFNNFWMKEIWRPDRLRTKKSFADEKLSFHRNCSIVLHSFQNHVWRIWHFTENHFGQKNPQNGRKMPWIRTKKPESLYKIVLLILWGGVWVPVVASKSLIMKMVFERLRSEKNARTKKIQTYVQKYLSECIRTEKKGCGASRYTAFPDFTLDVSTGVEVGISCDDGQWFHCIACIWWERNTSSTVSRSLSHFPRQLDTLLSHDYQSSINGSSCLAPTILNQLERNYAKKIQSELWTRFWNL